MIAKMHKVKFFYYSNAQKSDIEKLQDLGLADISVSTTATHSDRANELNKELDNAQKATHAFLEHAPEKSTIAPPTKMNLKKHRLQNIDSTDSWSKEQTGRVRRVIDEVVRLAGQYQQKGDTIQQYQDIIDFLSPFGDASNADIIDLKERDVFVSVYKANKSKALGSKSSPQGYSALIPKEKEKMIFLQPIKEYKKEVLYVVIQYQHNLFTPPPEWKQIYLKEDSRIGFITKVKELSKERDVIKDTIVQHASMKAHILQYIAFLENHLSLEQVNSSVDVQEGISVLQAFVPQKYMARVQHYAQDVGCGLWVQKVEEQDEVPVLVQNNKVVRIIKPIFDFLGTVPGYKEMDISGLFFLFITVFFSMIISDAGYGIVLLLLTIYSMCSTLFRGKKISSVQVLFFIFSFFTIVWGAVTGNYFGYEPFSQLPVIRDLIIPRLYTFDPASQDYLRWLTISIGFLHLTLARSIAFIRKLIQGEYLSSCAELSWLVMIYFLYRLALFLVVDSLLYPVPSLTTTMLCVALGGITLFSEQKRGLPVLKGVLSGLGGLFQTVLNVIGGLSDVISYVRLYAIGLASISIETAFNQMGMDVMATGIGGIIGGVLIILTGHTLNLVMGLLAVFVHGVRLNLLEFSGHLGMEWSGKKYNPFKKKTLLTEET